MCPILLTSRRGLESAADERRHLGRIPFFDLPEQGGRVQKGDFAAAHATSNSEQSVASSSMTAPVPGRATLHIGE